MVHASFWAAAFLSGALGLALGARRAEARYAGPLYEVTPRELTIDVLEGPPDMTEGMSVKPLPGTLRGRIGGIKSLEFIGLTVPVPPSVFERAVKGQPAELRHDYLKVPRWGAILGATTLRIGDVEWRESRARVYSISALLSLSPLLAWAVGAGLACSRKARA